MQFWAYSSFRNLGLACFLSSLSLLSNAALFEDDEARRAILDLRQRLETTQQNLKSQTAENMKSQAAENANLKGGMLELQNQIFVTIGGKAHSIPAIDSNKKTGQIIFEKRITIPPAQA